MDRCCVPAGRLTSHADDTVARNFSLIASLDALASRFYRPGFVLRVPRILSGYVSFSAA